ncbi:PQQ-dependent sugar dehydrogenase [Hyphomonas sp.]|uniref:PQQ-dependent sugar dehydrogenase n=1 Tax=Hyphomonas sp. TaxID=87 RepID=UPI003529618A
MNKYLRNRWIRLSLLLCSILFAFIAGAVTLFGVQNKERISHRLFPPGLEQLEEIRVSDWHTLETGLVTIQRADIRLGDTVGFTSGGAIDSVGDTILYASASGYIATVDLTEGKIEYSSIRVPMDFDRLKTEVFSRHSKFNSEWYRVMDILVHRSETNNDEATLYVSHHIFVPESSEICGVISQTGLNLEGDQIRFVDGVWDEFYRIRECFSLEEFDWSYFGLESGGQLMMLDNDHILLSVGDYGIEWELFVHDRVGPQYDNDFSKIISIDLETGEPAVYAHGFRNPQGLARDSDGGIWEAEHGPQGGDEINYVTPGADYGWPTVSLGMNYGSPRVPIPSNPVQGRHDGYVMPVMAFLPSIGISAITALPSEPIEFELWKNDLLAVSLREESLFHLRRDGDRIIYAEKIPLGARLRDVHILKNGWIAILTGGDRSIILLRDATDTRSIEPISISGYSAVNELQEQVQEAIGKPDPSERVFWSECSRCHNVNGENSIGPPLNGLYKRKIGSAPGYSYSEGLAKARGKWTRGKVKSFLHNPQAMYSDTTMPAQYNLESWEQRAILNYLEKVNDR